MIVPLLALTGGLVAAAIAVPAPAQAKPSADEFLAALTDAGIGSADPTNAVALGQSVCPTLSEPGQTAADVAAKVAETGGMPLGPATMFTGIAISIFCPSMVSSIGNGTSPIPLGLLGF